MAAWASFDPNLWPPQKAEMSAELDGAPTAVDGLRLYWRSARTHLSFKL